MRSEHITLSHCWGKEDKILKTTRYPSGREVEITWPALPKTFQDAVKITRGLGIRYLWIDALCIVQGDYYPDWERESPKMVYSSAFLYIAATHFADPSEGCHVERYRYEGGSSQDKSSIEPITPSVVFGDQAEVLSVRPSVDIPRTTTLTASTPPPLRRTHL